MEEPTKMLKKRSYQQTSLLASSDEIPHLFMPNLHNSVSTWSEFPNKMQKG